MPTQRQVFICYRRTDAPAHAGRLYDALSNDFGRKHVFFDRGGGIDVGEEWKKVIDGRLPSCAVLVALIGTNWQPERLAAADDLVRREISRALSLGVHVIPVLLNDAMLPPAANLPEEIRPILDRQVLEMTERHWPADYGRLEHAIRNEIRRRRKSLRLEVVALATLLVLLVSIYLISKKPLTPSTANTTTTAPTTTTTAPSDPLPSEIHDQIKWFEENFGEQAKAAVEGTPFTPSMLAAIAYAEAGAIWAPLRAKGLTPNEVLALCVHDTLDGDSGRRAFPVNKAQLLREPKGREMFAIARESLMRLGDKIPAYAKDAANPDKFAHSFGIFSRDLQYFKTDPDYFLSKRWQSFDASAKAIVTELRSVQARIGLAGRTSLTSMDLVKIAIAYNTGTFRPDKGLKQGVRDMDGRFYGERIYDYLSIADRIFAAAAGGISRATLDSKRPITRMTPPSAAVINDPASPRRTSTSPSAKAAELRRIIDWLDVENSPRYQPGAGTAFPNIYVVDYAALAGVYIPRVWWTNDSLTRMGRGETVATRYGVTVTEQNANDLFRWFKTFGRAFGWRAVSSLNELQDAANNGQVAVICARRTTDSESGHVSVVAPEFGKKTALRKDGRVVLPLQSQAGARNFRYDTGSREWWTGGKFAEHGFWVHN